MVFDGPEAFGSVAVILRETRESFGEGLREVAQSLRIRFVYLQAIEDGRFDDLPGHTYAVGFIRTYAEYLGLDGEDMVNRFKDEVRGLERRTELVFPTPVPEGKIPGGAVILLSMLLVGLAYGGWFYLSDQGRTVADLIPEVPDRLQGLIGSDGETVRLAGNADQPDSSSGLQPAGAARAGTTPPAAPGPTSEETAAPQTAPTAPVAAAEGPAPALAQEPDRQAAGESAEEAPIRFAAVPPSPDQTDASAQGLGAPAAAEPSQADRATEVDPAPAAPDQVAVQGQTEEVPVPGAAADTAAAPAPSVTPTPVGSLAEVIARNAPGSVRPRQNGTLTNLDRGQAAAPGPQTAEAAASDIPQAPSTAQLALAQAGTPRIYGSDNANARIVLRAKFDSWVQVRDRQDTLLLTRVLRAGDSYRVPNQSGLTLLTGNAGGLEIEVDGQTLAPLGPVGSVKRNIALDPSSLVAGTATQ